MSAARSRQQAQLLEDIKAATDRYRAGAHCSYIQAAKVATDIAARLRMHQIVRGPRRTRKAPPQ